MNQTALTLACVATGFACNANARLIIEDFDGMDFNSELNFDFSSDFTGGGDTSDHIDGVLWLYSDLANITVTTLAPGEWIESVEVTWTDFCGIGCTKIEAFGDTFDFTLTNTVIGQSETRMITSADLGEPITSFSLSSFEGRMEEVRVNVVPTPSTLAMIGFSGIMISRRKR